MTFIDLAGRRYGRLLVLRRSPEDYISPGGQRHPRWDALCDCGNTKAITGANLRTGSATSCGCFANELRIAVGKRNAKPRVSYSAAHRRIRRSKGSAARHDCAWCDRAAKTWAYTHDDPRELTEATTLPSGTPLVLHYSMNPDHYLPLCKSCHSAYDKRRKVAA